MDSCSVINSKEFFNELFVKAWEQNQGPSQSRFFANIALQYSPAWLIAFIYKYHLSICDFGCALGDATYLFSKHFSTSKVSGIDISEVAIQKAQLKYNEIHFKSGNIFEGNDQYDVIFSSNTLEHFYNPWDIANNLTRHANKFIWILVPFYDSSLAEHFYCFTHQNIACELDNDFKLIYFSEIDTSLIQPNYWHGKQTLLIYAHTDQIQLLKNEGIEVTLFKNNSLDKLELIEPIRTQLKENIQQLDLLKSELSIKNKLLSELEQDLCNKKKELEWAESSYQSCKQLLIQTESDLQRLKTVEETLRSKDDQLQIIKQELAYVQDNYSAIKPQHDYMAKQLDYMENSLSWKVTRPIRFVRHLPTRLINKSKKILNKLTARRIKIEIKEMQNPTPISEPTINFFDTIPLLPMTPTDLIPKILNSGEQEQTHKYDVICFPIIDWNFRYQRPQQIMSQFALNGHRVFYINPFQFLPTNSIQKFNIKEIKPNVYDVQLCSSRRPDIYGEVIKDEVKTYLLQALEALRKDQQIESAVCYIMIPSWTQVAESARQGWGWPIIYDCMDEWENFPGIGKVLTQIESTLVSNCDLLVVTAQTLLEKWKGRTKSIVLARNAADYSFYAKRYQPNTILTDIRHPIIGYYGAIADWFDIELALYLAKNRPSYTFVYVGGVFDVDVSELKKLPNVIFTGQQDYELMPKYLYHFDVCLIPFKINPITKATDPVKLYEYFCAGKPVVSVALTEVEIYKDYLYVAKDYKHFLSQLDQAVKENNIVQINERKRIAETNSWAERYNAINHAFVKTVPLASIIIVTYNNLLYTKLCIESILRHTEYPNYEIIIVDNHSQDQTVAYLRYLTTRFPNIHIILNHANHGFAKANNQGIEKSNGEYIILLNNDTVVPSGWLDRLLWHFRDPEIGMIGPVTNQVGNEAKIDVPYTTLSEMQAFSKEYTWRNENEIADIRMLAMFCVAMKKALINKVGFLDEQFGIGMFEDDDYSHRIKMAGYRVICANDVFIHHVGQGSFIKLIENNQYNVLFEKNRAIFENKWQTTWIPGRQANLNLKKAKSSKRALCLDD